MPTPPTDMMDLYRKLHVCMVRVTTEMPDGAFECGGAFHIQDGWLATARHVVTDGTITLHQHPHTSSRCTLRQAPRQGCGLLHGLPPRIGGHIDGAGSDLVDDCRFATT
jgi:hypothetical protein